MLDAFIIEQIKRRERKDERLQPRLDNPSRFPLQPPPEPQRKPEEYERPGHFDRSGRFDDDEEPHGIVYIDM